MRAVVIIPIYKKELAWFERISLNRVVRILGKYPICFLAPEGLDIEYEHVLGNCYSVRFARAFFRGTDGYNELMLSREFYQHFLAYEYILIHQLDAFVFSDELERFCQLEYDYIGAPWVLPGVTSIQGEKAMLHVGNGGFSLRNPKTCCHLLEKYAEERRAWTFNEDTFFSYYGRRENEFRVAPVDIAYQFSFEVHAARGFRKNGGKLPFGCHGWNLYSAEFYQKAFFWAGCDLKEYYENMNHLDIPDLSYKLKNIVAYNRLLCRARNGRSLRIYLPNDGDWTLHAVGEEGRAIMLLLSKEGVDISQGAYAYDADDVVELVNNLKILQRHTSKNLVLSLRDDSLVSSLENAGLVYGRDFISFWQEYIACAEDVMRNGFKGS